MKKKKKIKKRNEFAIALESPIFKQQIIVNKKHKNKTKIKNREMKEH